MTHAGNEPSPLWIKLVPRAEPSAEGVWTRRLVQGHVCVQRGPEPLHQAAAECPDTGFLGTWDTHAQRVIPTDPRQRLLQELAVNGM